MLSSTHPGTRSLKHAKFNSFSPAAFIICAALLSLLLSPARGQEASTVATVSAASFSLRLAPGSIAAAFGQRLATATETAGTIPLPTTLAGTTVRVNGEPAPLFFVSPGQVNFLIPNGTPAGAASIEVEAGDGTISRGTIDVSPVAPGLFTANSSGIGVLAAYLLRASGTNQVLEPVAEPGQGAEGGFVTRPLIFGPESESLFLVLYLTGLRQADPASVRVALGGEDYVPSFVGPAPGFEGLEQINLPLSHSFPARGRLSIVVKAAGFGASNSGEIEIGRGEQDSRVEITDLPTNAVLAGDEIEIGGNGFAANPRENNILMVADDGEAVRAEVVAATSNRLRVRVPPGAGSGELTIQRGRSEASAPIEVRTSISGIVEEARSMPGGGLERAGIAGLGVRLLGQPEIATTTSASGAFVLEIPSNQTSARRVIEFISPGGTLPYPRQLLSLSVRGRRDNQLPRSVELAAITGPSFATQSLSVAFLLPGRTPFNLPRGHFSSRIAQVTPFGATVSTGLTLSFPNDDGLAPGSEATLFKFDQQPESPTLGEFIPIGTARVSDDGATVVTAEGAITEGSYYFVSIARPTGAVIGRVVTSDGRPLPRAIVQARGRSTFTDGYGGFVLRDLPVLKGAGEADEVRLEVSYQRGDSSVLRNDQTIAAIRAGEVSEIDSEIVLALGAINYPPAVLAPARVEIVAGRMQSFDIAITDPNGETDLAFETSGSAQFFTAVDETGAGRYRLRMEPQAAGEFALDLAARDPSGASAAARIEVSVKAAESSRPQAFFSSVVTAEDGAIEIILEGSDPQSKPLTFRVTSPPRQGSITGTGALLTYTPARDFNGADRLRFVASNGTEESAEAEVTILVAPVNDAPQLEVEEAREVNAGERLTVLISASDVDGEESVEIEADALPTGATIEGTGAKRTLRWQPTITQQGVYPVTLRARDGGGLVVERMLSITVSAKWAKTSGIEGGFVNALVSDGGTIYAGTFGGGVYRSLDDGLSWTPANTGLADTALFITALEAFDGALYAGTISDGVFRSDDGGGSWTRRSDGLVGEGQDINGFAAHEGQLYAGTDDGVYRTANGGASWERVSDGLNEAAAMVRALESHDGTLYLGAAEAGIYRYEESSGQWTEINAGLDGAARRINELLTHGGELYAATGAGVFRYDEAEQRWNSFNAGVIAGASAEALAEVDGILYQAAGPLLIYRLADESGQWTAMSAGLPEVPSDLALSLAAHEGRLLLGSTNGIYRSNQERSAWAFSSAGLEVAQITSLLYDGDQLYASTLGLGVYRSNDAGRSWAQVNEGLSGIARNINWLHRHEGEIYAATFGDGVYLLNRTLQRWERMSDGLAGNAAIVRTLGSHASALYAGTFESGVYRFDAGAKVWSAMSGGLSGSALDVATLAEHEGRLFAGTLGSGIYRFDDAAGQWSAANSGIENPFAMVVRGLEAHRGALYAATFGGGVYRTSNGGESWEEVNAGLSLLAQISEAIESDGEVLYIATAEGVFRLAGEGAQWEAAGTDLIGQLLFALAARNGRLAVGTGGNGVSLLADAEQSWSERNNGLSTTFVNTVAVSGGDLYAGTLGGGVFRSTNGGGSWQAAGPGLPANANIQAIANAGGALLAATFGDGVYRSMDGGGSWANASAGLGNLFVNRLFVSGATIYAGTDGGVYRSTDGAMSWTAVNAGIAGRRVLSFANLGGVIYAGTDEAGVFRLSADGAGWTQSGLGGFTVTALTTQNGALYAGTLGGGIHRSMDGGESWTPVNAGLPETLNVYALLASGEEIYAGSIYGVFLSGDGGATWRQVNAGLGDPLVTGLAISGDRLFASTAAGGVFVSRIP